MGAADLQSQVIGNLFGDGRTSLTGTPCRRCAVDTIYAGKAITTTLGEYQTSFTYTDNADGQSDNISLDICDPDGRWRAAWTPHKGDKLSTRLAVKDWLQEGDNRVLDCGTFVLDSVDYSGEPKVLTMGAVSAPADDAFHATERTKTWEKTTLQQIATTVAKASKLKLAFDAKDYPIAKREQSKQTDADFISKLCDDYGLSVKIYATRLVIFDRAVYKEKDPAGTISIEDMKPSYQFKSDLAGYYTGVEITYTDSKKNKDVKYNYGQGPRLLKINEKVDSPADAERIAKGRLEKENHGKTSLSITTIGNPTLVASQCVTVVGLGPTISGKYYIDKVTHTMGGAGYESAYELAMISNLTKEVVFDAVDRLAALGVVATPAYWKAHYKDIQYLPELLVDMSVRLQVAVSKVEYITTSAALKVMTDEGVINNPDYWQGKMNALAHLDELFIKAANSVASEVKTV